MEPSRRRLLPQCWAEVGRGKVMTWLAAKTVRVCGQVRVCGVLNGGESKTGT